MLVIIVPFSVIAGLMAFLITYEEMRRHLDRKRAIISAVETGMMTALVLGLLSVCAAILLHAWDG
ncbi:MAG TPA: hypothetical protein DGT21_02575 [Armatimonadetes bacterium]|jgi:hypothetical protein|nr:hypothetical protein [Armatimonadota bacterium]